MAASDWFREIAVEWFFKQGGKETAADTFKNLKVKAFGLGLNDERIANNMGACFVEFYEQKAKDRGDDPRMGYKEGVGKLLRVMRWVQTLTDDESEDYRLIMAGIPEPEQRIATLRLYAEFDTDDQRNLLFQQSRRTKKREWIGKVTQKVKDLDQIRKRFNQRTACAIRGGASKKASRAKHREAWNNLFRR